MDLELSDDQVALAEGITSLCQGRFDRDTVRSMIDTGGIDRARWSELAETGVFSLCLPEAEGGVGMDFTDAAVVFEVLGRFFVPGPLVATFLASGVIDGAATGETVVGVIERSERALVEYPEVIDTLVVIDDQGLWRVDNASITPLATPIDPLTPVGRCADLPEGEQIGGPESAADWRTRGAVLTAALQLGLAAGATDLAVAYAMEREQFGKPIGSFQAVKHLCADMACRVEVIRAAVYAAASCVKDPTVGDAAHAAAVAKVVAAEGSQAAKDGVQVHGGMGFTHEVDAHLYLKRCWALEHAFGHADHHIERLSAAL